METTKFYFLIVKTSDRTNQILIDMSYDDCLNNNFVEKILFLKNI